MCFSLNIIFKNTQNVAYLYDIRLSPKIGHKCMQILTGNGMQKRLTRLTFGPGTSGNLCINSKQNIRITVKQLTL